MLSVNVFELIKLYQTLSLLKVFPRELIINYIVLSAERLHILTYSQTQPCISKVYLRIQIHFQPNTNSGNLLDKHTPSPPSFPHSLSLSLSLSLSHVHTPQPKVHKCQCRCFSQRGATPAAHLLSG